MNKVSVSHMFWDKYFYLVFWKRKFAHSFPLLFTALQDRFTLEWFSVKGCVGSQLLEGISELWTEELVNVTHFGKRAIT